MPAVQFRNQGGVPFVTLRGVFVARQRQMPDGDTIAFAADGKFKLNRVDVEVPVDPTGAATVNIRLQSLDAPEKAQPWGAASRDKLLRHLGFEPAALGLSDTDFTVNDVHVKQRGWVATHGMDVHGRLLGYVFRKNPGFKHGEEVSAADVLSVIGKSANHMLVASGAAFPAFYNNTEETHAVAFQRIAAKARRAKKGVWSVDSTVSGFEPTKEALDADGALVYPKFYRRVAKWKQAQADSAAFIAWLKKQNDGKKLVYGAARDGLPLWQLFVAVGKKRVAVPYDVTKLWFSE